MNELKKKTELSVTTQNIAGSTTIMTMIEKALMTPEFDVDKLSELLKVKEQWEANEARKSYVVAMARFSGECPTIDKTLEAHNSTYAGLAETLEQIKGLLSDCGLSHSWKTNQDSGMVSVTCCVTHIQGHSECTTLSSEPDKTGSKNSIQAIASTVKYLERYTLFAILGLASKDKDDNDGNTVVDYINESQVAEIKKLISELKVDEQKFLRYIKADSIERINAGYYSEATAIIERKRK